MNFDIYLIGRTYKKGNVYYLKYSLICSLILFDCMYLVLSSSWLLIRNFSLLLLSQLFLAIRSNMVVFKIAIKF